MQISLIKLAPLYNCFFVLFCFVLFTLQISALGEQHPPSCDEGSASDVLSSASQDSLTAGEMSQEWQPTPQVQMKLQSLNNFLRIADGRVSPVRSQLSTVVGSISSPSVHYYKRKCAHAVETVLEAIAPGQSKWLLQQVIERYSGVAESDANLPEKTLLSRLITLCNVIVLAHQATNSLCLCQSLLED